MSRLPEKDERERESEHSLGTVNMDRAAIVSNDTVLRGDGNRQSVARTDGRARLLSLKEAAEYLGVSYWLLRDYIVDGVLTPVRLPGSRLRKGGRLVASSRTHSMRKIMVDREDLNRLIEDSKA